MKTFAWVLVVVGILAAVGVAAPVPLTSLGLALWCACASTMAA